MNANPQTPAANVSHSVNYFAIFVALVVLTVLTLAVSMKRFNSEFVNIMLAMIVATIKASLVAIYFMHLKFEGKMIYAVLALPLILCSILVIGIVPDVSWTDPLRHAAGASMHLFNPLTDLFKSLVK